MSEYTNKNLIRPARKGQLIIGLNCTGADTKRKLHIQALMRKFYGKTKDKDKPLPHNPFPYAFNNGRRRTKDIKLLKDLGQK